MSFLNAQLFSRAGQRDETLRKVENSCEVTTGTRETPIACPTFGISAQQSSYLSPVLEYPLTSLGIEQSAHIQVTLCSFNMAPASTVIILVIVRGRAKSAYRLCFVQ